MPVKPTFGNMFEKLTGNKPFPWQRNLYTRFQRNYIPPKIDIPTGLGKTSIIPIWLISLSKLADKYGASLNYFPRRIVYTVDNRTLIDSASDITLQLLDKIQQANSPEIEYIRRMLYVLAPKTANEPLSIKTLRGEKIDDKDWEKDIAISSIIIDTIDTIGSRLLFSGYNAGSYYRPYHAGILGKDTLLVHDESHLSPAFADTLSAIKNMQHKTAFDNNRNLKIIEMSATLNETKSSILRLSDKDRTHPVVNKRLNAHKTLSCNISNTNNSMRTSLVNTAWKEKDNRKKVLIYLNKSKDAELVANNLNKKLTGEKDRIELLTGALRKWDRDHRLVESHVMKSFLNSSNVEQTIYLVCTSAGEVGIDIDADVVIMESSPMDSIIQRLGRLNRKGIYPDAKVILHHSNAKKDTTSSNAFQYIQSLTNDNETEIDVSINKMFEIVRNCPKDAYTEPCKITQITDYNINKLALSTSMPNISDRQHIGKYLHGQENYTHRTRVVWRSEVNVLSKIGIPIKIRTNPSLNRTYKEQKLTEWYNEVFPISTLETVEDYTENIFDNLNTLFKNLSENKRYLEFFVQQSNKIHRSIIGYWRIREWMRKDKKDIIDIISNATIILPAEIGGISEQGIMDGKARLRKNRDVSGFRSGNNQIARCWKAENHSIEYDDWKESEHFQYTRAYDRMPYKDEEVNQHIIKVYEKANNGLVTDNRKETFKKGVAQYLENYSILSELDAKDMVDRLCLPKHLKIPIAKAALLHDQGKSRHIWQRYAMNSNTEPLAVPVKTEDPSILYGYRHELGSLLEINENDEYTNENALVSHLIATHHKYGRPHFKNNQYDQTYTTLDNQKVVARHMLWLSYLNRKYGAWGLAWLESIIRCIDHAVISNGE